jgi:hypothetical protein
MAQFLHKENTKTLTNTAETLLGFCANAAVLRLRVRASLAPSNPPLPLQLLAQVLDFTAPQVWSIVSTVIHKFTQFEL